MLYLLLLILPAGLSLKLRNDFFKDKLSLKDYIFLFIEYIVVINLVMFSILYLYSYGNDTSIYLLSDEIGFVFKFYVISLIVSIFVPFVLEYIKKLIEIKVSIKKLDDKYGKKNNK